MADSWDPHEERRLVRRIDIHCMVSLCTVLDSCTSSENNLQPALFIVRLPSYLGLRIALTFFLSVVYLEFLGKVRCVLRPT